MDDITDRDQNYANNMQHRNNMYDDRTRPLTMWQWVGTLLLLGIPFVNIVLLFVWAFGDGANINKRNYSRASLIIAGIVIALYIIILIIVFAAVGYVPRYNDFKDGFS